MKGRRSTAGFAEEGGGEEDTYEDDFEGTTTQTKVDAYEDDFEDTIAQTKTEAVGSSDVRKLSSKVREENIHAAFTKSSFRSLRQINLDAGKTIPASVSTPSLYRNKAEQFSTYKYQHSPLSLEDKEKSMDKKRSRLKREKICACDFVPSGNPHSERGLGGGTNDSCHTYVEDPYERFLQSKRKERRKIADLVRSGPFVPSGGVHSANTSPHPNAEPASVLRGRAQDLIRRTNQALSKDWNSFECSARTSGSDHSQLVVSFTRESIRKRSRGRARTTENAIAAYFETFLKSNKVAKHFRLRKDPRRWRVVERDGSLAFYFKLPWNKARSHSAARGR